MPGLYGVSGGGRKPKSMAETIAGNINKHNAAINEATGGTTNKAGQKLQANAAKKGMTPGEYANRQTSKKNRGVVENIKRTGREIAQTPAKISHNIVHGETKEEAAERRRKYNLRAK